jgi:hypothetical protein
MNRARILGGYLLLAGILQACAYVELATSGEHGWLFYFDPRIGTFFLETGWRSAEQVTPGIFRWLSVGWIPTLGVLLLSGRTLLKTCIVSEIAFSLPNVFFFVVISLRKQANV